MTICTRRGWNSTSAGKHPVGNRVVAGKRTWAGALAFREMMHSPGRLGDVDVYRPSPERLCGTSITPENTWLIYLKGFY
jgi:hypothetical protein